MKRPQTKRGRVSLCRRVFNAKDWRGKKGRQGSVGEKGLLAPGGYRQAVGPPNLFM